MIKQISCLQQGNLGGMKLIVTATLLLLVTVSYGQLSFGAKGGLSYVNQEIISPKGANFEITNINEWRPSFHAGIFLECPMGKKTSLVGELLYSDKGYRISSGKTHIAYLTVPLLVRYKVYKTLALEAGAEGGILLSSYVKYPGGKADLSGEYSRADWGVAAGIHYAFNSRFGLGIRYVQGVANVINRNSSIISTNNVGTSTTTNLYDSGVKYRNQALQLSIEYSFGLNKQN